MVDLMPRLKEIFKVKRVLQNNLLVTAHLGKNLKK